ncbi:hypothetical protein ABIF41_003862 [Bradyrhizobium japonicum]
MITPSKARCWCSGTPHRGATTNPLFGGPAPVGIGVSGTYTDTRAEMTGTALVGKASLIFGATLHKLAEVD